MDGIASLPSVGAATRVTREASVRSPRPVTDQRSVAERIGTAALTLIQAAIVAPTNHSLDVRV